MLCISEFVLGNFKVHTLQQVLRFMLIINTAIYGLTLKKMEKKENDDVSSASMSIVMSL